MVEPRNYVRKGITLGGIDVVVVAANETDAMDCIALTEEAINQHGTKLLLRSGHPTADSDPILTAPILDGPRGVILGYVELADG